MQMYDIICKKKTNKELTTEEINWLVKEFTAGNISDAQMTAFLMAVYFNSMTERETLDLTLAMEHSGDVLDLSSIDKITVDKHSTGGVGDKTTLFIAPTVASLGVKVPKMSGRGLGHTGGTIDKLESIEGFNTSLSFDEFSDVVKSVGCAVVGQTGKLTPADKKIYAPRDVTATVDSIPLIASSIMSKKLATGNSCILLDVKCGSGAFMKDKESAKALADTMVKIGKNAGRNCAALITDMTKPLGRAIGNSLEVIEAAEALKGKEKGEFFDLCIELSANMLSLAGKGTPSECAVMARDAVESGKAFNKFKEMISAQGGNPEVVEDYKLFKQPKFIHEVYSDKSGIVTCNDCEAIGLVSLSLGAGRTVKDAPIDHSAGVYLDKLCGERVEKGEKIATLYSSTDCDMTKIGERFSSVYQITDVNLV
ncbi:MAG: thymidine phosphorylase [Oscillospiraceae bacterium]|nr:thymidine phosphorylase [Oscillospiraceae bacterium]